MTFALPLPLSGLRTAVLLAAALVLIGLVGWGVYTTVQLQAERAAHAKTMADHATAVAAAERQARVWEGRANDLAERARESNDAAQRTITKQAAELAHLRSSIVVLRADADGLRQQFAAAGAERGAAGSLAACVDWTGALQAELARGAGLLAEGQRLLVEGAELAAKLAEAHDRRATEVLALIAAWPHKQVP